MSDSKDSSKFDQKLEQHDPLCPSRYKDDDPGAAYCLECAFVARVRADERQRIAQAIEARADTVTAEEGRWQQSDFGIMVGLRTAARIARGGQGDT